MRWDGMAYCIPSSLVSISQSPNCIFNPMPTPMPMLRPTRKYAKTKYDLNTKLEGKGSKKRPLNSSIEHVLTLLNLFSPCLLSFPLPSTYPNPRANPKDKTSTVPTHSPYIT